MHANKRRGALPFKRTIHATCLARKRKCLILELEKFYVPEKPCGERLTKIHPEFRIPWFAFICVH